jgi:carbonic anhydrase
MEPNRPASHRLRHHLPRSLPGVARAKHFGVAPGDLDDLAIADPHKAVAVDVAALKAPRFVEA